jgi:hypothetical protein
VGWWRLVAKRILRLTNGLLFVPRRGVVTIMGLGVLFGH